jgi:beta-carotene 15,15'-dioxygenase
MTLLRIQGLLFCILSTVLAGASMYLPRLDQQIELIVIAVLILVLGVPHGALDTIFARQLYSFRSNTAWIGFVALYIALAALTVGLWILFPSLFLVAFFFISVAHFSGDLSSEINLTTRILYGGSIIVLPALLHAPELSSILALLVGTETTLQIVRLIDFMAWPWLTGIIIAAIWYIRKDWLSVWELTSTAALAVLLPPLLAFTIFFCAMHSARHILRTFEYAGRSSPWLMALASIVPMIAVFGFSMVVWRLMNNTEFDTRVIQLVFVGLAALTVPHMVLVEQVRLSGWMKGAARD